MTDETIFDLYATDLSDEWDELPIAEHVPISRARKDRQLNLRVGPDLLASLRDAAGFRNLSYHALARSFIEEGLVRLQTEDDVRALAASRPFGTKEATLVLLAEGQRSGELDAIEGRTRLQKLMFLLAQHMKPDVSARFEAYNYGPFEENLNGDIEFLASEGLIEAPGVDEIAPRSPSPERGARLVQWVEERAGPAQETVDTYRLTQKGLNWVSSFFDDPAAGSEERKHKLVSEASRVVHEYGKVPLGDLIAHVYSEYPEFAENSLIRDQVRKRRRDT